MVRRWSVGLIVAMLMLALGHPATPAENVTVAVMVETGKEAIPGAMTLNARGVFYKTTEMAALVHIPWEAIIGWAWNASLPLLSVTWDGEKGQSTEGQTSHANGTPLRFRIVEQWEQIVGLFRQYAPKKETPL